MVIQLLTKFKLASILLTVSTLVTLSFITGKVYAAAPQPVPGAKIPCPDLNNPKSDPNFNSSRPYQASPCGDSPKAIMCGNTLQVIETTPTVRKPLGTQFADVNFVMGNKTYAADVTGASFPIAGNTELTANSQNPSDQIDDATKMNEYLNWYLNGTTDRAEYGDNGQTIDYAGPVKKLLPSAIQDAQRIITINNLKTPATYGAEEPQNPGQHPGPNALVEDKAITHDQIVVCTDGSNKPIPCYNGDGTPAKGTPYRLSGWIGDISILRTISNTILQGLSYIPGINEAVATVASKAWNNKEPPLPWGTNPNTGKEFTPLEYQKAYNEWRGQSCIIVPIINRLICVDNPLITNQWADLYPYIPLSNTVDKNAHLPITGVGVNGVGGTVVQNSNPQYKINQEPVLYYPHTAETSELSDFLNQTYVPKEGTSSDTQTDTTEPLNIPTKDMAAYQNCIAQGNGPLECQGFLNGNKCNIINVRSNPGDYLFPEIPPSQVNVYVNEYTVTRIPCHDVTGNKGRSAQTGSGVELPEADYALCQGQVAIEIRMNTKVPYATEIFNSTTAGADSTFRKIYPKVSAGAPVSCVANIPSVTDVQYTSTEGLDGMKVIGPLGDNTTDNPKLYFPHFGSVYDYFLKGIQTALRPQGYGDPTPASGKYCTPVVPKDCSATNVPDSAIPSKYLGSFKSNFINMANIWTTGSGCEGASYNLASQCYNYVVSEAQKAGVNPAFALTIWLNESGASNYCFGGPTTQDFGINLPGLYQNVPGQISAFLNMANQKLCSGVPGFRETMHGWLSRFKSVAGTCDPNYQCGTAYAYGGSCSEGGKTLNMDVGIIGVWKMVTGGCVNGNKFAIQWPTDMNCP